MHIKHLTLMSGPAGNFEVGHVREVSDKEAAGLIAGGYAIEVKPPQPETATARRGETATAAEQDAARHLANIKAAGPRTGGKAKKQNPPAGAPDEAAAKAKADQIAALELTIIDLEVAAGAAPEADKPGLTEKLDAARAELLTLRADAPTDARQ